MAITRIKVANFKSFKELDLELGKFNVIVGANASGKSNFTQIFKFIRDIVKEGLENAISIQGSEYLTYMGTLFPKTLSIECTYNFEDSVVIEVNDKVVLEIAKTITHDFALRFEKPGGTFEIVNDKQDLKINFLDKNKFEKDLNPQNNILGSGNVILTNNKGKLDKQVEKPDSLRTLSREDILKYLFVGNEIPNDMILLQVRHLFFMSLGISFSDFGLYDFDPKLSKSAISMAGKFELEEDGSNLSLVLKSILENEERKRKFSNLMKDLLPFVEDISTDKFADKSLLFKLKEKYFADTYFPASFISDGTVNISALLVALYFEKKGVTIIEEPERNIHPHLISKIVDMMKDASKNKQIIVTTHNPEVVKYAGIENLLLISRDKEGFSTVSRPKDNEKVRIFLKNELGLDDIYVQNLLED